MVRSFCHKKVPCRGAGMHALGILPLIRKLRPTRKTGVVCWWHCHWWKNSTLAKLEGQGSWLFLDNYVEEKISQWTQGVNHLATIAVSEFNPSSGSTHGLINKLMHTIPDIADSLQSLEDICHLNPQLHQHTVSPTSLCFHHHPKVSSKTRKKLIGRDGKRKGEPQNTATWQQAVV